MIQKMIRCPVVIYRGGTSKAVFLKETDLPADPGLRDRFICAIFGSPDKRQIDGLGGADPLTSKLAIIGPPSRPDADVDYTSARSISIPPSLSTVPSAEIFLPRWGLTPSRKDLCGRKNLSPRFVSTALILAG